jgi:hypothetical protein
MGKLLLKPIIEKWNLQMDLAWAFEQLDCVQHGLFGASRWAGRPGRRTRSDLGGGAVGRPQVPYSDESRITK